MSEPATAGRALDAEVARLVFGMQPHADCDQEAGDDPDWLCYGTEADGYGYCPEYSTSIAAAWQVVEHLRAGNFSQRYHFAQALQRVIGQRVSAENIEPAWAVIFFMTPEDICRAALAALQTPEAAAAPQRERDDAPAGG